MLGLQCLLGYPYSNLTRLVPRRTVSWEAVSSSQIAGAGGAALGCYNVDPSTLYIYLKMRGKYHKIDECLSTKTFK